MKIVVLDGFTLNPGDLNWDGFEALGELTVYDRTPNEQIIERAKDAEIVLTNKTPLTRETLDQLPNLKYIGVLATGFNIVDIDAAKEKGIPVTNVPTYSTNSVAQFTFALLLNLCHHVQVHSDAVFKGEWVNSVDFCFTKAPLIDLAGKTMGIIGYGRIGQQTAKIAEAFGMDVIVMESMSGRKGDGETPRLPKEEFFAKADVVSLHCPLTPETEGLINKETLALMKKSAFVINTARGPVINEADLAEALNNGQIAGAGLDVLSVEPPTADNPLLSAKNCVITPHIAWATFEARERLMGIAVNNAKAFIDGSPVNVVNG